MPSTSPTARSWRGNLLKLKPNALLFDWAYWRDRQTRAALIVALFVMSLAAQAAWGIIDFRNVVFLGGPSGFFTFVIQGFTYLFGVLAFLHGLRLLARLDIETVVATEVRDKSETARSRLQGRLQELELAKVPTLWPDHPESGLSTLRLCRAMHADAMDSQFTSREMMLAVYREEWSNELTPLQVHQRAATHFGILGTFLGLTLAIPQLVRLSGAEFDQLTVTALFNSLLMAFATSVTGLIVSLCVGWLASHIALKQNLFFDRLEQAALALQVVVRNAHLDSRLARTLGQVQSSLNNVNERLASQNRLVDKQTATLQTGIANLQTVRANFESFLEEHVAKHAKLALTESTTALEASKAALETTVQALQDESAAAKAEHKHVEASLAKIREELSATLAEQRQAVEKERERADVASDKYGVKLEEMHVAFIAAIGQTFDLERLGNLYKEISDDMQLQIKDCFEAYTQRMAMEVRALRPVVSKAKKVRADNGAESDETSGSSIWDFFKFKRR